MTHFVGLVIADDEDQMAERLKPYSEETPVKPYFEHVTESAIQSAADYYKTEATPQALAKHWVDWHGASLVEHDGQWGCWSTHNPEGFWDWYSSPGRWSDVAPKGCYLAEQIPTLFEGQGYFPSVLVDESGWHSTKDWGWFGTSAPRSDAPDITAMLAAHTGRRVYVVDFHT